MFECYIIIIWRGNDLKTRRGNITTNWPFEQAFSWWFEDEF